VAAVIDPALQGFLESGVSIFVSTRDNANVPALTRGAGCSVSPEGRVTVYVAREQAGRCLDDAHATGAISVLLVLPHTYESFQLKGTDAHAIELDAHDRTRVTAYRDAFFGNLAVIGLQANVAAGLFPVEPEAFVGLTFVPTEISGSGRSSNAEDAA
jgi:hypothetical protein